jgi:Aerotolerance regulator N-terminal
MIGLLFANPGFLFIAATLISVPIIIHLINRMRFKRIKWAAMEFLLKAQKRTRRRLIIEQLLLLALRCFLIGLVGLLVSRFIGCSESNVAGKPNLHLVLLDDTLSMQDSWKHTDGSTKSCFDVATKDIIVKKIARGVSMSGVNDRLIVMPLSKINDSSYTFPEYDHLNDQKTLDKVAAEIGELRPSFRHVSLLEGVKAAKLKLDQYGESTVTMHVVSDFRHADWGQPAGDGLIKQLLEIADTKDVKIIAIDTVLHPARDAKQSLPEAHDNIGIIDFRPSTRVVAKKTPVRFTVTIRNFSGKQMDVMPIVRDESTGTDLRDVDFNPPKPIKLSPDSITEVTFDRGDIKTGYFFPNPNDELKPGETRFAHLSIRLADVGLGALANDALQADNIRYAVVEVRDTVPILVIDGMGSEGQKENNDSYMLARAAISPPGKSYEVEFGPAKTLEGGNLGKYPFIYLLNVQKLNEKQIANLESYVKEGGGVAFFLGPLVNKDEYNKALYKNGTGIFPAPLKAIYPALTEKELPEKDSDTYQIITREDQFPNERMPIFGAMFENTQQKLPLRTLPIHRYVKVDRAAWKPEKGRVYELATLPNDEMAAVFEGQVGGITQTGSAFNRVKKAPEIAKYEGRFRELVSKVEARVQPGKDHRAYQLAEDLDRLLNDKGVKDVVVDMTEFWASSNPDIQTLRDQFTRLRDQVHYGDPFIITQTFGKGRVVAVMSTAGKDWNKWSGGSIGSITYPMFIWELQNYLSSPGAEGNLMVGTNLTKSLDADPFQGKQVKLVRKFLKARAGDGQVAVVDARKTTEERGVPVDGKITFTMTRNDDPGVYLSELYDDNGGNTPIARYAHAFNVDTLREGALQRVASDLLDKDLVGKAARPGSIKMVAANAPGEVLVPKKDDFSESPWLFLILLLVLVAEQALAVHLSFHLKDNDGDLAPAKS